MDCWKKKVKSVRTIGFAGSIRGCGVTHLSVAAANYAAGGLNEKTAYLELIGHGEISHWKEKNESGYFVDYNIHYYPDFKREQIPILLNRDYERIIMDFGDGYNDFREEILRCDKKIFLLNLNPWQKYAAEKMVNTVQDEHWGDIQPVYMSMNAQKTEKEAIEKKFKIRITKLSLIQNPRSIRSEEFSFMDSIMGYAAVNTKRKRPFMPIRRIK